MNLVIRPYEIKDAVFLAPLLVNELGYEESTIDQMIMRLRRFHVHPDYHIFVAIDHREVIGFIGIHKGMAYEFDQEYIKIIGLKIKKDFQTYEVGAKLLESVEAYAKKRGIQKILVSSETTDDEIGAFYQERDYRVIGSALEKKVL